MEAGVERLMGNRHIYLRALARFRTDYRHAGAAIRAALDGGDMALAQRLAHTLKGAAGMIEAGALSAATLAFEQGLRSGEDHVDALFLRVDEALSHVLHELEGMALALEEPASRATPAGPHTRARLRTLLDIGDGAAVELVAAARTELAAELGEREYEALRAAVMVFDYERALELLDQPDLAGK
ncbi:Hpt domain-containing protein [Massilia niabensis]|uniref:Hpt domain-containing protein n=1 Tax=Massilia niabensis TaxID=544910 RepID=A0ABW0L2W2_9BURK